MSIATGKIAYKFIRSKMDELEEKFEGLKILVYPIENTFFGPKITVTGLITGGDLIKQLKGKDLGDIFLDDVTLDEVALALDTDIAINSEGGKGIIKSILNKF